MCDELTVLVKLKEQAFLKRVLSAQRVEQVGKNEPKLKTALNMVLYRSQKNGFFCYGLLK